MANAIDSGTVEAKKINLYFNLLCIICQKEKSESLVEKPSSCEKAFKFIEEWAKYGKYIWKFGVFRNVELGKNCEVFHLRSSK